MRDERGAICNLIIAIFLWYALQQRWQRADALSALHCSNTCTFFVYKQSAVSSTYLFVTESVWIIALLKVTSVNKIFYEYRRIRFSKRRLFDQSVVGSYYYIVII